MRWYLNIGKIIKISRCTDNRFIEEIIKLFMVCPRGHGRFIRVHVVYRQRGVVKTTTLMYTDLGSRMDITDGAMDA